MHPLRQYLVSVGLKQADLAKLSGVSTATISKVILGRKQAFNPKDALAISKATHGKVRFLDLALPPDAAKLARKGAA